MRILLIDILRTSLEEVWPTAEHSLGLMYLAAALKREYGDAVTISIRTFVSRPNHVEEDPPAMLAELERFAPEVLGIRCLTIGKDCLNLFASVARQWNPDCFLVAGGPYATDDPDDALASGLLDCVVLGEGEVTFNELIGRLQSRLPVTGVPGIAFRSGGATLRTAPRQAIADLDWLPLPDYSLIDLERFSNRFLSFSSKITSPHANIMTTRGCPYRCAYCHHVLGKTFRTRSPEGVLAEMRHIRDTYGITDFQIIDDIFNLDLPRAKRILDLMVAQRMNITLSFPNAIRGDRVDEELIDKMAAAGTKFVSYAVETASPRLQKLIRKNMDVEKSFQAIEYTAAAGIVTRGFFMLGFPTETEEEVIQTIEYAKASALCGAAFFTVVYFPGTDLYALARSLGYFRNGGYDVQRDYVNVGEGPYAFSLERLAELKRRAIREFAFTRQRLETALRLLPGYFTPREIDTYLMAYVVSSGARPEDIEDETVRNTLHRHFAVAERFSRRQGFYV
jgi:radical SAM superfamily enzyme YgiQ (UPF0313 family)